MRKLDEAHGGASPQVTVRLPRALHVAVEEERQRLAATVPRGIRVSLADAVRAMLARVLLPGPTPPEVTPRRVKVTREVPALDVGALRGELVRAVETERARKVPRARLRYGQARVAEALGVTEDALYRFLAGGPLPGTAARRLARYLAGE